MWRCGCYLALLLVPTALVTVGLYAAALSAILHAAHHTDPFPLPSGPEGAPGGPGADPPGGEGDAGGWREGGSGLGELVGLVADQEDPVRRARLDWATFQAQQVRERGGKGAARRGPLEETKAVGEGVPSGCCLGSASVSLDGGTRPDVYAGAWVMECFLA